MSLWTWFIRWTQTFQNPIEAEMATRVDIMDKLNEVDLVDYVDNVDLVDNLDMWTC